MHAPQNRSDASHNSETVYSFQTILPLLKKVVRIDLLLANRSGTWTYQVLLVLQDFPASQQFLAAIRSRESTNLKQFVLLAMKIIHTHFGVPMGFVPGW